MGGGPPCYIVIYDCISCIIFYICSSEGISWSILLERTEPHLYMTAMPEENMKKSNHYFLETVFHKLVIGWSNFPMKVDYILNEKIPDFPPVLPFWLVIPLLNDESVDFYPF